MIETLFGGLIGGVFRILPEVLKWLDKRGERSHELQMLQAEMEFAKLRGEIAMRQTEAQMTVAELNAMSEALKEQGQTARAAGRIVAAISALVRPTVTYWLVFIYSAVKYAAFMVALDSNPDWRTVLTNAWAKEDMALLNMVLTFWFVGRIWEKNGK